MENVTQESQSVADMLEKVSQSVVGISKIKQNLIQSFPLVIP